MDDSESRVLMKIKKPPRNATNNVNAVMPIQ